MCCSMSLASRTARAASFIPSDGAAASAAWKKPTLGAASGLNTNPTRPARGAISLNNSTHLPPIEFSKLAKPVMFLPGCAQTGRKAAADRVADEREYDRYGLRFLLNDPCHLIRAGHHDVGRRGDQLSCKSASLVGIAAGPTIVDLDVAPFNPAQALQALQQRRDIGLSLRIALGVSHEHADAPHPLGLLRPGRERPCGRRAAEKRNELAPSHSITAFARASSLSGIVSPSALAVLRLMTRSNSIGCSIGISAGFAPRSILSTRSAARRHMLSQFGP
jgi:hypothetical protein